jgi:hypothetical protein
MAVIPDATKLRPFTLEDRPVREPLGIPIRFRATEPEPPATEDLPPTQPLSVPPPAAMAGVASEPPPAPPPTLADDVLEPPPPAAVSPDVIPPPPVSVVVVHRSNEQTAAGPPPRGHRRPALGDVPMDEDQPTRSFRRVIDRLTTDIADRLEDDRHGDRS